MSTLTQEKKASIFAEFGGKAENTGSIEAQLEYHQVATDAENKFKALVKITAHSLNMMLNHCEKVEQNTGSLTSEDVKYSVSLLKRTIEHNFKKD